MSTEARKVDHDGIMLSFREAAEILSTSYATVYAMFKKGAVSIAAMRVVRQEVSDGKNWKGGKKAETHMTSRGVMSIPEMSKIHEFGLTTQTLRSRGDKWGFDHKCLWLNSKDSWAEFHRLAIELDGLPRGLEFPFVAGKKKVEKGEPQELNRLKACFREKGTVRCVHYAKRLAMDDGYPESCLIASGNSCNNFEGNDVKVHTDCSGRPPRSYQRNGTFRVSSQ